MLATSIERKCVWCVRNGKDRAFWIKREVCIAAQSNPALNRRCKHCKERQEVKK